MNPRKYDRTLPKNLTYRKGRKAYAWRNPLTKKEFTLGRISKQEAIANAIEANYFVSQNYTPVALIEKLKGLNTITVKKWIERYKEILNRRDLSACTYKVRHSQLMTIEKRIGGLILTEITTRHVASFLEEWIAEGKNTMAGTLRTVLFDMFREAIIEGIVSANPVEPTRVQKGKVTRERIKDMETYNAIRKAAEQLPPWFQLAMDLAMVTGQRREDISRMKFSDIYDGRLHVTQSKTGMKIAFPLSLTLSVAGLRLGTVVDRCRLLSKSDFLISPDNRKNEDGRGVNPDGLTRKFIAARNLTGIQFSNKPPTFHEIRSLAGRLYKEQYGEDFAQKFFGHVSDKMTKMYLNERDQDAYVML